LSFISQLPGLKHLKLSQCSLLTNTGIAFLSKITSLVALDISKCRNLGDIALQHVTPLENLQLLNLSSLQITDSCGPMFPASLCSLDLSGTRVSQHILSTFCDGLKANLQYISLAYANVSTDERERFEIEEFSSLCRINLDGTALCYDGSLFKLRDKINQLRGKSVCSANNGVLEIIPKILANTLVTPSKLEKKIWMEVGPYFMPYLNQELPWPCNSPNVLRRSKREFAQTNKLPTPTKKRKVQVKVECKAEYDLTAEKENFEGTFESIFPLNKNVYQSIYMLREGKGEYSPGLTRRTSTEDSMMDTMSPLVKTNRCQIGGTTPIPVEITKLLELKPMSPFAKRSRT
jgi:hypothetical protein